MQLLWVICDMERDLLIQFYFHLGLKYREILCSLAANHKIIISMWTINRELSQFGLSRRKYKSDLLDVAIVDILTNKGNHPGYRWLHLKCIHAGLTVDRETVRLLLKIVDPELKVGLEGDLNGVHILLEVQISFAIWTDMIN